MENNSTTEKPKNHFWIWYILALVIGLTLTLGWYAYEVYRLQQVPFVPQKSNFKLAPPRLALTGTISGIKGEVKKQGREDEDYAVVKSLDNVIEGESFATGKNGNLSFDFADFASIEIKSNSEISLSNLIPDQFLIIQREGSVAYKTLIQDKPLSVRSLHLLITILGSFQISTAKTGKIMVEALSGTTKLAYVDTENETQVVELTSGKAIFDDTTRTIIL